MTAKTPQVQKPKQISSVDSERSFVGSLLIDAEHGMKVAASFGLTTDQFTDDSSRRVFGAVTRIVGAGVPCEPLSVQVDSGLDVATIQNLIDGCPTSAHAEYFAGLVAGAHAKRRAIAALSQADGTEGVRLACERITASLPSVAGAGPLKSLAILAKEPIELGEVLLGDDHCRYLERAAVLLLDGGAGTGKSHFTGQSMVSWSCGVTAFGLTPTAPLRCLALQAENPPNDARAIAKNMLRGLGAEAVRLVDENTRQLWLPGCTGDAFLDTLDRTLTAWPADLVYIDPLLAFSPGDLAKPEVVQDFCRRGLNVLAARHKCGLFICHHTPKPTAARDPSKMGAYDMQYGATGNADLAANWPRARLTLQALARGEFLLRATKRRPPWRNADGEQVWEIGVRHTEDGVWETFEADPDAVRTGRPPAPALETFRETALQVAANLCPCSKGTLAESFWRDVTGARNRGRELLDSLIKDNSLLVETGHGRGAPVIVKMRETP